MKTTNNSIISNKIVNVVFFVVLSLMSLLYVRFVYLSISNNINGLDLQAFAKDRNTEKLVLTANRGTIYDSHKNILAQNIRVYKLIAYLSPKRSNNTDGIYHVIDPELTAEKLAPILDTDESKLLKILSKKAYQVEFGRAGSALTELKKEEIEKLNLPGLDFELKYKRYYPNGAFLSYILGYAKTEEDNTIKGEMGLELFYDEKLRGVNGTLEYQKDPQGYKISNTKEYRKDPVDGKNIYLTVDTNIQLFLERAVKKQVAVYKPETMLLAVMEAKTGKILGVASEPSFDPNLKDIESYMNPLVSSQFEPGSTMKIFTYLNTITKGNYDGSTTFTSGSKTVGPDKVNDWRPEGWGTLTYDQGFQLSSNVGIANIVEKNLSRQELYNFYQKLGFGSRTNFPLANEEAGEIDFRYPLEVMNAGFGQGITVTPIQMLQAFTAISNNGKVLKPYIVDSIVDSNTKKVILKNKPKVVSTVATSKQVKQVKELMYNVVNCGNEAACTGYNYAIKDLSVIGKTGTAQVALSNGRGYLKGDANTIKSFVGIFPKDDPKYVLYVVVKRPRNGYGKMLSTAFKEVVDDLNKYANLIEEKSTAVEVKVKINSYLNQDTKKTTDFLTKEGLQVIVIGNGPTIIKQSIASGTLLKGEKIFLQTSSPTYNLPKLTGYSTKEVTLLANLLNLKYHLTGSGYVISQTPSPNTLITKKTIIKVSLEPRLN